jgi:hypothetical protein
VLVAPSSPSRTRSPEPQIVGEVLADDARTTTPPRGIVDGMVTSPPVADTRAVLTVKIRQPSHEFTFGVGISFIPYPLVLTPVV